MTQSYPAAPADITLPAKPPVTVNAAVVLIVLTALVECTYLVQELPFTSAFDLTRLDVASKIASEAPMLSWWFFSSVMCPLLFAPMILNGSFWPQYLYAAMKITNVIILAYARDLHPQTIFFIFVEMITILLLFLPQSMRRTSSSDDKTVKPNIGSQKTWFLKMDWFRHHVFRYSHGVI